MEVALVNGVVQYSSLINQKRTSDNLYALSEVGRAYVGRYLIRLEQTYMITVLVQGGKSLPIDKTSQLLCRVSV